MPSLTCTISRPTLRFAIDVQKGLSRDIQGLVDFVKSLHVHILVLITNGQVASLYGAELQAELKKHMRLLMLTMPSGESAKCRAVKEELENQMFEHGCGRDTCVLALGGGVVCDVAGYVAATYCRGLPLILLPTSLMAMVDAAIGGKTSVNVPQGKNLIGVYHQPQRIIIDPDLLKSLPEKEFKNGIIEMIKHGLIADAEYFDFLEANLPALLQRDEIILEKAIYESCRIKKEIVERDEKEAGLRSLLNFGHTVGHALEKVTQYRMSHGEAVARGIIVESELAHLSGELNPSSLKRISAIINRCDLLHTPIEITAEQLLAAMLLDKKTRKQKPRIVLLQDIGKPRQEGQEFCFAINESHFQCAIERLCNALCCH